MLNGEVLMTLAVDEKSYHDPYKIDTKATEEKNCYKLNGKKTFVSNGNFSDHIIVLALTDSKEFGLFLVKSDTLGITMKNKILLDTSTYSEITLNDVCVPKEYRLDVNISGKELIKKVLDISCIGLSAEILGIILAIWAIFVNSIKLEI